MLYFILLLIPILANAEIPDSLVRLAEIKDKNSEAYMFEAHKAAMDARYSAESALEGENSSLALKILSVGLKHMPHRGDLKNLRNTALNTYVNITKKLEEDSKKNCAILLERYHFLDTVAPDALAKLKNDRECGEEIKAADADYLRINEPVLLKELEAKYKSEHIWKNTQFPFDDVLNNSFMLLRSLYGESFSMSCVGFKPIPNTTEGNLSDVNGNCKLSGGVDPSFRETSYKYYSFLDQLLIVTGGSKAVMYTTLDGVTKYFKTTDILYNVYETAFDNESFDEDMPNFVVMNMNLKYKNRVESQTILVKLNHQTFKETGVPQIQFEKGEKERFALLNKETIFYLSNEELKGLQDIQLSLNYKRSFEIYKNHFEMATKADMECRETKKKIDSLTSSRQKKKLQSSYEASCPVKGTLGAMLRAEI